MKRWILAGVALLVLAYAAASAWLYWLMQKPPEQFAQTFARLPEFASAAFPFQTLWRSARSGALDVGEPAPQVELTTLDKQSTVRIGGPGERPVLLVFGSYT